MVCRDFILPEPASYVFFYAVFNLRNLLYIIVRWDSCTAAQGRRSLVQNEVTQNSPDIQVSGLFAPQDAQYRVYPV